MNKQLISLSKFLSLVLRHQPEVIGVQLDPEGWVAIDTLIEKANENGTPLTLELLHEIVATSDKRRFALTEDGLRIRANQGHSIAAVELNLQPVKPPDQLFHGTVAAFIESIRANGLEKRSRNHVHLSGDEATAIKVAQRRGKPIVLIIDAAKMHDAGFEFYCSENGVWLSDRVPIEFIRFD